MNNNVYIKNTKDSYDNEKFSPHDLYEEGINLSLNSDKQIYSDMRDLFKMMGLDKEHMDTCDWNPFGSFIKPNDKVLIKPNLVMHQNKVGTIDCMITNFSIIRPIIDYTIIALKGQGEIIVGDAPVQDCDFSKLKLINNLEQNILLYQKVFKNIRLVDFRKNQNSDIECITVNLGDNSAFSELDDVQKEYSITNYNLSLMNAHHSKGVHEYIIPKDVLFADVIINVPKPKTHRKAGMTACMKNFVGINGNKECLPHHRSGGPSKNGDEFPEDNIVKNSFSWISKYTYKHNKVINFLRKGLSFTISKMGMGRYREGSWYGNDTIWRTIIDLNKLIMYTDKNGLLTNTPKRKIFNICDMVISGEGEGPLLPSDKKVGLIVCSYNQLNCDYTIAQIMGFNPYKFKYIKNGYKLNKFVISKSSKFKIIDEKGIVKKMDVYNKDFTPTDGYKDYLKGK